MKPTEPTPPNHPSLNSPEFDNPFAPPTTQDFTLPAEDLPTRPPPKRSWLKSLGIWSAVCTISAIPSFAWGFGTIASDHILAMCTGIGLFIIGYTLADQLSQNQPWRRHPIIRRTLKIGYITRMAVSIIFPIGAGLDLYCGVLSLMLAGGGKLVGFLNVLTVTLIQGTVLNAVLGLFMLVVGSIQFVVKRLKAV